MRLFPAWDIRAFGYTVPAPFWPPRPPFHWTLAPPQAHILLAESMLPQ